MAELSDRQRSVLLKPIQGFRVSERQGMSYLEAYDVLAHLSRVFGFEGWDKEITSLELAFEDATMTLDRPKWSVCYRCTMRLTIRNIAGQTVCVHEDASSGDALNQPSRSDAHDLAIKSAVSGALKRCAKDLGDQFGLGLYDSGKTDAVVNEVVPYKVLGASDLKDIARARLGVSEDGQRGDHERTGESPDH